MDGQTLSKKTLHGTYMRRLLERGRLHYQCQQREKTSSSFRICVHLLVATHIIEEVTIPRFNGIQFDSLHKKVLSYQPYRMTCK